MSPVGLSGSYAMGLGGGAMAEARPEDSVENVLERLQQQGTISLPSLTKEFDLPTEFLIEQVHARLGSILCCTYTRDPVCTQA